MSNEPKRENTLAHYFRKRNPAWREPKRTDEAMPEHPRWKDDVHTHTKDGLTWGLLILKNSPVLDQRIRDWLVVNFDKRSVTLWIEDLIRRELPDEGWNYRDGYDPAVLLKKPKD